MSDPDSECTETMIWLNFARECNYITSEEFSFTHTKYNEIGKMLGGMISNPEKFLPKKKDFEVVKQ